MLMTILGIVAGGLITIVTALFVESMKRPRLSMQIEETPQNVIYEDRPARTSRYLRVLVSNESLPKWSAWLLREAAIHCTAEVTFHDYVSGRRCFQTPMPGRWASSVEPVPAVGVIGDKRFHLFDPSRWTVLTSIDIPPGEKAEPLDIVARFDDDAECFAWNNESYFCQPPWRNRSRALQKGQYIVRVLIRASGQRCQGFYILNNPQNRDDFRLEPTKPDERKKVEEAEALGRS